MFKQIRFRLLTAYLAVMFGILIIFAAGVRGLFYHILSQKIIEKLTIIAESSIDNVEFENGRLNFDENLRDRHNINLDQTVLISEENLELFSKNGVRVDKLGQVNITLPLSLHHLHQIQSGRLHVQGVTVPIIDLDSNQTIGYIRASQSLAGFDESLTKLDIGLGAGILFALILSSVGGIWLTKQAIRPAESSFQRLQQFTADSSHELRSPLMAIKSNVGVALKYPAGMRTGDLEKFQAIASATDQMTRLTEDLLWLARTDVEDRQKWETVDLTTILKDVVEIHQTLASDKKISLNSDIAPDLVVSGDRSQLRRIFNNLLENAIYYTPPGGRVTVNASLENRWHSRLESKSISVNIQDTGIGIAAADMPKIFDRFWRADTSRTQWEGGSGLGLSIVKTIVECHGGHITVNSQLNMGSCFTVQLPISTD